MDGTRNIESGVQGDVVIKQPQAKPSKPADENVKAVIHADLVVHLVVAKVLSGNVCRGPSVRARAARVPRLPAIEQELREMKMIIEALAVRSIAHELRHSPFDVEGVTVLDADVACRLLDNPPEPNAALRNILSLR